MTRSYTIQVVPSRRGWLAMCNGQQASVDGRERNPGTAALALAEQLWPGREPRLHRLGRSLRYSVVVDDSRPELAPAPQDGTRVHTAASAAPQPEPMHQ